MRLKGLDFLRGISILLVLFRHSEIECMLNRIGWAGVDVFFVLSGFLVSGLIFNEYKKNGSVNLKRFLIRRGFKIYPPFYIMIAVTLGIQLLLQKGISPLPLILSELLYMQSYLPAIWHHTWSLSVEEHFYLMLPLFAFFSLKYNKLRDLTFNVSALTFLLLINFIFRFIISFPHRNEEAFYFFATHLRMDGILTGVLISYLYHFTSFYSFVKHHSVRFGFFSILLVLPIFFFPGGSFFMNTYGYVFIHTGFALMTLLVLDSPFLKSEFLKIPVSLFAFIGVHSYSIYLWHLIIKKTIGNFQLSMPIYAISYFALTIAGGILLSMLIEKPFLNLRDRLFPAKKIAAIKSSAEVVK